MERGLRGLFRGRGTPAAGGAAAGAGRARRLRDAGAPSWGALEGLAGERRQELGLPPAPAPPSSRAAAPGGAEAPPSAKALRRDFGATGEPRVVLYRDRTPPSGTAPQPGAPTSRGRRAPRRVRPSSTGRLPPSLPPPAPARCAGGGGSFER